MKFNALGNYHLIY